MVFAVDGPGVVVEAAEFGGEFLGEAVDGEDAFGADAVDGFEEAGEVGVVGEGEDGVGAVAEAGSGGEGPSAEHGGAGIVDVFVFVLVEGVGGADEAGVGRDGAFEDDWFGEAGTGFAAGGGHFGGGRVEDGGEAGFGEDGEGLLSLAEGVGVEDGSGAVLEGGVDEVEDVAGDLGDGGEDELRFAEGGFHDEGVGAAEDGFLGGESAADLEVAGVEQGGTVAFAGEMDHRRAVDVSGGEEEDGEALALEGLVEVEGDEAGGGDVVTDAEQVGVGGGGEDLIVAGEVVGVAMGDEGAGFFAMGIEPEVGLGEVETVFRFELDGLGHGGLALGDGLDLLAGAAGAEGDERSRHQREVTRSVENSRLEMGGRLRGVAWGGCGGRLAGMRWAIRLGRVAGTEVRVHVTFLILLAGLGMYFWLRAGPAAAVDGVLFVVAVFGCVLLHEFGHVLMAKAFGVRTPDITLLPIGGLARMEKMPEKPWQELLVAIAGPAVNVVIALILLPVAGFPSMEDAAGTFEIPFLQRLLLTNVVLVVFNMIPAFPMDGGRVLRSLLAMVVDYTVATRVAAAIGQGLAVVGGLIGVMQMHPLLIFIAIFIFMGARGESEMVQVNAALRGVSLRQAMMTDFRSLRRGDVLGEAVRLLLAGPQHDFPVLDEEGRLVGLLTRARLIEVLSEHGRDWPVEQAMMREVPRVSVELPVREAYAVLRSSPIESLPVMAAGGGEVLGLLTAENVGELILVRSAVGGRRSAVAGFRG